MVKKMGSKIMPGKTGRTEKAVWIRSLKVIAGIVLMVVMSLSMRIEAKATEADRQLRLRTHRIKVCNSQLWPSYTMYEGTIRIEVQRGLY
jgi:hypothetical protein